MTPSLVFDASQDVPELWAPLAAVLFVALAFAAVRLAGLRGGPELRSRLVRFPWMLRIAVTVAALIVAGNADPFYRRFLSPLGRELGASTLVEGPVTGLTTQGPAGHGQEHFRVGTVDFSYADDRPTGGFHQTRASGGPLREGVPARVRYISRTGAQVILGLELGE